MSKIADYLRDAGVFYIATMDGDQPRVRPFGAVTEYKDKIYFCTNNKKKVFKQFTANQKVEICTMAKDGTWIRVTGKVVVDDNDDARRAMLEAVPSLNGLYKIGDGIFEVFHLKNMAAKVYSFTADPVVLK